MGQPATRGRAACCLPRRLRALGRWLGGTRWHHTGSARIPSRTGCCAAVLATAGQEDPEGAHRDAGGAGRGGNEGERRAFVLLSAGLAVLATRNLLRGGALRTHSHNPPAPSQFLAHSPRLPFPGQHLQMTSHAV